MADSTDDTNASDWLGDGYRLVRRLGEVDDEEEEVIQAPSSSLLDHQREYLEKGRARTAIHDDITAGKTPAQEYKDRMMMVALEQDKLDLIKGVGGEEAPTTTAPPQPPIKRRKWDAPPEETAPKPSRWDQRSKRSRFDQNTATTTTTTTDLSIPQPPSNPFPTFDEYNRPISDAELDAILPTEGYSVVPVPDGYSSAHQRHLELFAPPSSDTTTTNGTTTGFQLQTSRPVDSYGVSLQVPETEAGAPANALPMIRPDDMPYFGRLLEDPKEHVNDTKEQINERVIMELLLRIKNGLPNTRRVAMRTITDDAPKLGAGPIFNQLLPLLMSPTLDEAERHLLVKVIDRVLFKLSDLVRPWAHKILAVTASLLIEPDFYARVEGREIIANLSKAVGLATMITTMRPDLDNPDDFVRNVTARAFAVVASALGVSSLLPFLRAVCRSKKWEARHTGVKIVQQISTLLGCTVLPHLSALVECVKVNLSDEQPKVKSMTALCLAALAEAAHPYGFDSFIIVMDDVWTGVQRERGKALAAFIKAAGYMIPLMDEEDALRNANRLVPVLIREFKTPDDETKSIVLRALKQCAMTHGVTPSFIREHALTPFFTSFWIRRSAMDRKNKKAIIETTVSLASKVGAADVLERVVNDLKDDSEPYRRTVMTLVDRIVAEMGTSEISSRLEERLVDGALYAFQEQDPASISTTTTTLPGIPPSAGLDMGGAAALSSADTMLRGLCRFINSLGGTRAKPHIPRLVNLCKQRLQDKSPEIRMQACDCIAGLSGAMRASGHLDVLGHLGMILFENLGEEYPDVLGSVIKAISAVFVNLGVEKMTPAVGDLLPRLTPILKNPSEKVAEALIDLVGRIADVGAAHVAAREWMRVCFDLLELLRSPKIGIRRAAVSTFGFIARAVGPQDVLHTLLNNLRVQERQLRVCTTVAIAIVSETCAPFTVLPALMNEYRTPDTNVQNGVLKALVFMTQYLGPVSADYVNSLTPLLQHALSDRDHVHRQTACDAVRHLALGVAGRNCEDALTHLLNFVIANIFEQSPHVHRAVMECLEALRVALGSGTMLSYILPGLFHPAHYVRDTYWRFYNNLYVYDADALVAAIPRLDLAPVPVLGGDSRRQVLEDISLQEDNGDGEMLSLSSGIHAPLERDGLRRTYLEMFL